MKVDLTGEWISSFIQNNKIYNEKVNIKQDGNKVLAKIFLNYEDEECNYIFEGVLNNRIINGVYERSKDEKVESGTISLKIINKDFLYGVTTYFSPEENSDELIQSPYALFRNTEFSLGTFNLCSNCVGKDVNCCCSENVDSPMLLPREAEEIAKIKNIKKEEFSTKVSFSDMYGDENLKDLYQLKKCGKSNACYFYRDNKCTIYDIRPIDCRIFPYDIKLEKDGNYYLVFYKTKDCQILYENIKDIKMVSYNTRLFLRLLLPYLREWSDKYCCTHLTEHVNYEIICKIEDLF